MLLEQGQMLQPNNFHAHWHVSRAAVIEHNRTVDELLMQVRAGFDMWPESTKSSVQHLLTSALQTSQEVVADPLPPATRGRPRDNRGASSTRRDPSAFENVESSTRP